MLVIRLSRRGRKKRPTYRLVLQEKDWAPTSKAIENLGHLDPHTDPPTAVLKEDRIKYWLEQGAQPSNTVHNLLVTHGVMSGDKKRSVFGQKEVSEEELAAQAEAEEAAKAAKEAPAEDSAPEAPAEEPKEEAQEEAPKEEEKAEEE